MEIPINTTLVYVSFSSGIDKNTTEQFLATMAHLANQKVQNVYLLLSTPGGGVTEGLNLYNVLCGMPFELITHNVSSVNSIGIMPFLAGSKRYATETATFMFHGVGYNAKADERLELKRLRELSGSLSSDQERIGDVICQNTSIRKEEIDKLFLEAQTKGAIYAKEKGIIHDIRKAIIQKDCPVVTVSVKR
jgi:ATP-dependent Clp protease protease subunit